MVNPTPPIFKHQQQAGHGLPAVQTRAAQAQKDAAADIAKNVFGAYNKAPPPPVMIPKIAQQPQQPQQVNRNADARPWYVKEPARRNVSESHAAYGAFYNSPTAASAAAAIAQARALQDAGKGRQPEQYKGYYTPAAAQAGQAQYDAARAGNWPQQGKLQPVQYDQRLGAQVASVAGGPQAAAAMRGSPGQGAAGGWKPPPWNYGGGGMKASPVKAAANGWQGGVQDIQGAAVGVARYPPIEWQAPRMR